MSILFWLKRTLIVFVAVFVILFVVELLKGHGAENALEFALLWGVISSATFTATRLYYSRKGVICAFCDDTPESQNKSDQ